MDFIPVSAVVYPCLIPIINMIQSPAGQVSGLLMRDQMLKKKWIRDNDLVLIAPWDFQSDKADIIWRYISAHADKLEPI